jgi:hypothetical protein
MRSTCSRVFYLYNKGPEKVIFKGRTYRLGVSQIKELELVGVSWDKECIPHKE